MLLERPLWQVREMVRKFQNILETAGKHSCPEDQLARICGHLRAKTSDRQP
jgi:hypothetical protein